METIQDKINAIDEWVTEMKCKQEDIIKKYRCAKDIQQGLYHIADENKAKENPIKIIYIDGFGEKFFGEWEHSPIVVDKKDLLDFLTAQRDKHIAAADEMAGEIIRDTQ